MEIAPFDEHPPGVEEGREGTRQPGSPQFQDSRPKKQVQPPRGEGRRPQIEASLFEAVLPPDVAQHHGKRQRHVETGHHHQAGKRPGEGNLPGRTPGIQNEEQSPDQHTGHGGLRQPHGVDFDARQVERHSPHRPGSQPVPAPAARRQPQAGQEEQSKAHREIAPHGQIRAEPLLKVAGDEVRERHVIGPGGVIRKGEGAVRGVQPALVLVKPLIQKGSASAHVLQGAGQVKRGAQQRGSEGEQGNGDLFVGSRHSHSDGRGKRDEITTRTRRHKAKPLSERKGASAEADSRLPARRRRNALNALAHQGHAPNPKRCRAGG